MLAHIIIKVCERTRISCGSLEKPQKLPVMQRSQFADEYSKRIQCMVDFWLLAHGSHVTGSALGLGWVRCCRARCSLQFDVLPSIVALVPFYLAGIVAMRTHCVRTVRATMRINWAERALG